MPLRQPEPGLQATVVKLDHGAVALGKLTQRVCQRGGGKDNEAIIATECCLMRLIGVNGMRDENAGAEKSHQYCCKLNHDTRPYAQPALVT
jgi:hypothetical protein